MITFIDGFHKIHYFVNGFYLYIYFSNANWPTHTSNAYHFFMVKTYKYTWWQFICPLQKKKKQLSFSSLAHLKLDCLWIFLLSSWVLFILSLLAAHQSFCRLFVSLLINYCFCCGEDLKSKFLPTSFYFVSCDFGGGSVSHLKRIHPFQTSYFYL